MRLSPARGPSQFTLRSLVPAAVFLLTELLGDLFGGDEIYLVRVVTAFLGGWFLSLILCAIARDLPWKILPQIFVIWFLLFVVRLLSLSLEYYFFSTEELSVILRSGVESTIVLLVLATVVALLFPSGQPLQSFGRSVRFLLAQRRWFSWVWRVALGVVTYVFVYFVFGGIAFQFTQPYYTDPAYGLKLTIPPAALVFGLQFVRGFIYLFPAFFLLAGLKISKLRQAWLLGMALFVLGGLSPLVSAEEWPVALRVYHTVEIFFQNFTTGVMLALLLGVAPPREQRGLSGAPTS